MQIQKSLLDKPSIN